MRSIVIDIRIAKLWKVLREIESDLDSVLKIIFDLNSNEIFYKTILLYLILFRVDILKYPIKDSS